MKASLSPPAAGDAGQLAVQPVGRLLWHNCSQTTASVGLYGIYALTNAWFVAHGAGDQAMAAVNLASPLLFLLGAVSTTVGAGGASLVSRALGAGDRAAAGRSAGNAFLLFWSVAAVTTVAGLAFLDPLLDVLGARGPLHAGAKQYAVILLCSAVVSTGFSSLVRAEGRVGFSLLQWLVGVTAQITLDPLLIFGFGLGVRGAALGTAGGQAVSTAMSFWFFFIQRDRPYRVRLADLRPHAATLRALVGLGLPSFLAGIGVTLLVVLVNTTLAGIGAATVLVAYAVCSRLQTFAVTPQTGISQGMQPVVGYNAGRGLTERVLRARTLALRASLVYGAAATAVLALLAGPLVGLFLSDPQAAAQAADALRIIAISLTVAGIAPLTSAYFQALGRPAPAYLLTVGSLIGLKAPLVVILGHAWGVTGVWISLPAGELATAAVAFGLLLRRGSPAAAAVRQDE